MKNEIEFEVENIGDDDSNLWVVTARRNKISTLATGRDITATKEEAKRKLIEFELKCVAPNSPNFENSEVAFLMKD